jgi:hypothetical protein
MEDHYTQCVLHSPFAHPRSLHSDDANACIHSPVVNTRCSSMPVFVFVFVLFSVLYCTLVCTDAHKAAYANTTYVRGSCAHSALHSVAAFSTLVHVRTCVHNTRYFDELQGYDLFEDTAPAIGKNGTCVRLASRCAFFPASTAPLWRIVCGVHQPASRLLLARCISVAWLSPTCTICAVYRYQACEHCFLVTLLINWCHQPCKHCGYASPRWLILFLQRHCSNLILSIPRHHHPPATGPCSTPSTTSRPSRLSHQQAQRRSSFTRRSKTRTSRTRFHRLVLATSTAA